jgi:DNA-binding response OmpR family regulator
MTKQILLCDDEIHILRAAQIKLSRAGYDVRTANDGQEAWEAILEQCPDMLITDCQMPRLDGFGLIERIRNNPSTEHLAVLMLTAKGFEMAHRDISGKWGLVGIMAKPFSPRELLRYVEQTLAGGAIEHAAAQ